MQARNKTVVETLIAIDAQRIPAHRLRGLKPSVVRFCFADGLIKDYRGYGVMLSAEGVEAVLTARPGWQSTVRAAAEATA